MKIVLVTGATGFVGRFLCERLLAMGLHVRGTLIASESPSSLVAEVEPVVVEPLSMQTPWLHALTGVDTVIHLAARVHIMNDPSADPLVEFRTVNTAGSKQLASEACRAGVKRFVFVSSIKVNGEEAINPYNEESPAQPKDAYAVSKYEAEQALLKIEAETCLEVVIVRPTLVYGPRVRANFLNMLKIVQLGIPLPFASIKNKRSLLYVGNLVDALALCATSSSAAGQTYLVSDGEDVSTPELIRRTAQVLGVPARLFPIPASFMYMAGKLTGKSNAMNRLVGSLAVDSSKIRQELGWKPPFTMEEGLRETAEWFKRQ